MAKRFGGDLARFLVAGGINTALTTVIYLLLILVVSPELAYVIAWLVGLVFVVVFYPDRVFVGGRNSLVDRILLAAVTLMVFVSGVFFLRAMMALTGESRISFIATLCFTTAANFVLGRLLLRRTPALEIPPDQST